MRIERPGRPRQPLADRFWAKVQKTATCWIWTGRRDRNGYGLIRKGGATAGYAKAHRVAWFLATGRWPDPNALHRCDNPPCVRVHADHVFEGTQAVNIADAIQKGRFVFPVGSHQPAGERNGRAKLNAASVREIRRLAESGASHRSLGRRFGVSSHNIRAIIRGQTWGHLS